MKSASWQKPYKPKDKGVTFLKQCKKKKAFKPKTLYSQNINTQKIASQSILIQTFENHNKCEWSKYQLKERDYQMGEEVRYKPFSQETMLSMKTQIGGKR